MKSATITTLLVFAMVACTVTAKTFRARIRPIRGSGSDVRGVVTVYQNGDASTVSWNGRVTGVERNLGFNQCRAANGCGIHIHDGFSCRNTATQGGHYFVDPISDDPWVNQRYSSNQDGKAWFSNAIKIGTNDFQGRTFVGEYSAVDE